MFKNRITSIGALIVICSTYFSLNAQTTETVATKFSATYFSAVHGTDLYVSENQGNKIVKIDLSTGNKTAFKTGIVSPFGLAIKDNDLFQEIKKTLYIKNNV